MVCEMELDCLEDTDIEVLSSMWPEDIGNEPGRKFNFDKRGVDQVMLEVVPIVEEPTIVDFKRLLELTNYSEKGSSQLTYLVKQWEHKQANATRLLREELDNLSKKREEVELKKLEILEEHRFEERFGGDKRPVPVWDDIYDIWNEVPRRKNDIIVQTERLEVDTETDSVIYWKQRALHLEELLKASTQREQLLVERLQESIEHLERQSSPVDEFSQILKRADNFLHFILQNSPVVIGHQDNELRYRFIYNHFPSLEEQDIIGKTDLEIFNGAGVKESHDFKKEVLERGIPAKREITFETELFGMKTFLIYVEPVFNKAKETIGVNYMGMEVTDQVRKREKMAMVREEFAVQKAKETELNKTIHITEETMRAKQMLATMSHEIRSPLSGVVSMAEILATTKLEKEQRQLLDVMLSSGDLVLQIINDILDLSKVESGVMKLEATKFRPREVIKHVLQTAAASLRKTLTLEGHIAEDVPVEVIGDVLRIRQILTNLISNAVKFTHNGKVGIKLSIVADPCLRNDGHQMLTYDKSKASASILDEEKHISTSPKGLNKKAICDNRVLENGEPIPAVNHESSPRDKLEDPYPPETVVWLRCDVYDTGIGIPENALPTLFKKYMQVSADHARKYGGTGLGLAICKQLIELMGGHLTVCSQEHCGSTFTFVLPYKVSAGSDPSGDPNEFLDMGSLDTKIVGDDANMGDFQFHPHVFGSALSSDGSRRVLPMDFGYQSLHKPSGLSENLTLHCTKSLTNEISLPKPDLENVVGRGKPYKAGEKDQLQNPIKDVTHCIEESKGSGEMASKGEFHLQSQGQEVSGWSSHNITRSGLETHRSILKPKILLVEDNKINVMVTRSMMKQLGHNIHVVSNGVEALRAVQDCHYELILMDVCMPVMDGLQATRIIRSFEETGNWDAAVQAGVDPCLYSLANVRVCRQTTKRIPIIAMTANALAESADECFAHGMDSYISKPVTFQKLKECLQKYLT